MLFASRTFASVAMALLFCATSPPLHAQKRVEAGIFLDYLGISQTKTNNFGLGARFGYRIHPRIMLEGELAYDYGINFNEAFRDVSTGNIAAIQRTSIGVTHGWLGPKLQPARERGLHPFLTAKAGFMDFRLSPSLLPLPPLANTLIGLRTSNLNFALDLAGGVEPALGPLGLRLELGDAIYFNNGAHHNLRITFGPYPQILTRLQQPAAVTSLSKYHIKTPYTHRQRRLQNLLAKRSTRL